MDAQLVKRVQQGDRRAFDVLVAKYQSRILSVVGRFVSRDDAPDVAQEAFVKCYRSIGQFRGDSAFYTWLYRISVNCAKNFLASKQNRQAMATVAVDDGEYSPAISGLSSDSTPDGELSGVQLQEAIAAALDQLPAELRRALILREIEGLSYDEIAATMECPVGTVRSRIFRAREALDKVIKPMVHQ